MVYLNLIHNLSLLVALGLIHQVVLRRLRTSSRLYQIISGVIFGSVAVVGMLTPVHFAPGIIFDARSVVLAASGMTGGPLVALIAASICAVARMVIGGGGAVVGVSVVFMAAGCGAVYYLLRQRYDSANHLAVAWFAGLLIHIAMLGLFLLLPDSAGLSVVRKLGLVILFAYPLATMLLFSFMRIVEEDTAKAQKLSESESRFKLAMDAAREGIFDWNLASNEVYYSPGYSSMLGYEPADIHGSLEFWKGLTHPDDAANTLELVLEHIDSGTVTFEAKFRMLAKSGEWRWIHAHASITARDDTGRALRIVGTHTDITAQIMEEEVLAAQLRLANYSIKHSVQEVLIRFLDEAEKLTGSTIGFYHLVNADQVNLTLQAWSSNTTQTMCTASGAGQHYAIADAGVWVECIRSRQPVVHNDYASLPDKRSLPPGHAPVIRELVVPVIRDEKIMAVLGVGNKATDYSSMDVQIVSRLAGLAWEIVVRRQSEELSARLTKAIEQAAEAVVIMDEQGRIQYANPAIEALTGYPASELQGNLLPALEPGTGEQESLDSIWERLRAGEAWRGTLGHHRKNGDKYHEEIIISPVLDAEGALVNLIAVKRDITDQLKLQAEKERVEEQYRQAQKMEAIGTLAGGIAHDFNNILFAILGNADIAKGFVPTDSPAADCLQQIMESGQRAAELVKQILTFARKTEKRHVAFQVSKIVKEVVNLLRSTLPATITITQHLQTQRTTVLADPSEIHQVILNLCTNAGQAMLETGGTLDIHLSEAPAGKPDQPASLPLGEYLLLRVKDTGAGIPAAVLPRIFEPFFTTKGTEGTGMGLAVAHGIITSIGGLIEVTSNPPLGTEFKVYLPLAIEEAATTDEASPKLPRGTERILLVDDEVSLTMMLRRTLSSLGYEVTTFNDSMAALAAFSRDPSAFDVVITDQTMPRLTGAAMVQRMKEVKPDVPVILFTGFSETASAEQIQELSIQAFLSKPVPLRELAESIRNVCDTNLLKS